MDRYHRKLPRKPRPSRDKFDRRSNSSVWAATTPALRSQSLTKNAKADVCVVGGGIAGLTAGYLLAREGKSVIVIDKGSAGRGETINTSGHLSNEIDATYRRIARQHGEKGARLAAQSHTAAIAKIESIAAMEGIDCDFELVDGYLFCGFNDSEKTLDEELEAAQSAGLKVSKETHLPAGLHTGHGPCLRFSGQAQFHAGKYIVGLVRAFKKAGGKFFAKTEAKEIKGGEEAKITTTKNRVITAEAVVVATNTPINDWVTMHTKQAAYRTYVIGVPVPVDSIPAALYWDTEEPFHYVRVQRAGKAASDILIIGGEDHKTGQHEDLENRFARLLSWGRTHFPGLADPEFRWSRPSDGHYGWISIHWPQPRRRTECVHRHRGLRGRPDPWNDRGHADNRHDHGPRKSVEHSLRSSAKESTGGAELCQRKFKRSFAICDLDYTRRGE